MIFPGTIRITKDAVPEGSTPFGYTATVPNGATAIAPFNLIDDGTTTNTTLFNQLLTFGAYTFTETVPSGWQLQNVTCTESLTGEPNDQDTATTQNGPGATLNLDEGEDIHCTYHNRAAKLEVRKTLVPASDSGRFDLGIDGTVLGNDAGDGGTTGEQTVTPGNHTVSEAGGTESGGGTTNLSNYTTSLACVDQANSNAPVTVTQAGVVNITAGMDVVCTFTNTRKASVTIIKDAVGGTGSESFTFTPSTELRTSSTPSPALNGSNQFVLQDNGSQAFNTALPDTTGTYTVAEDVPAGWRLTQIDCSDADSTDTAATPGGLGSSTATIRVSPGESVTCTFTNTKAATVTIVKDAIGGTGSENFTFTPNAALRTNSTPDPALNGANQFVLQDNGTQNFNVVVPATGGTYTVAESALAGWRLTQIACNDGDSTDLGPTAAGVSSNTADINVSPGEHVTCTFTNTKAATVTIVKDAIGGTGSENFTFTPNAALRTNSTPNPALNGANQFVLQDNGTQTFEVVVPATGDTYTVTEAALAGWRLTQIDCTDGDSTDLGPTASGVSSNTANINVSPGESVTCTFTNTKAATVTIVKDAIGGDGTDQFTFTPNAALRTNSTPSPVLNGANQFVLQDNGTQNFNVVVPATGATYTVAESALAGWRLTQIACDDGDSTDLGPTAAGVSSNTADINVSPGEHVTCTFTNTKAATVTIVKDAIGGGGGESFTFTPNAALRNSSTPDPALNGANQFVLQDSGSQNFNVVVPATGATYTVAESALAGWRLTQIACDDGDSTDLGPTAAGVSSNTADINVSPGEHVTCTFTNTKNASVKIVKQTVGGAPTDSFTFTPNDNLRLGSTQSPPLDLDNTFSLVDDGEQNFNAVIPSGTYTVAETVPAGWRLTQIDCSDTDSTDTGQVPGGVGSSTATINVAAGESVTCTFTNTKAATVRIIKQAVGGAPTDSFGFTPSEALRTNSTPAPALVNNQFSLVDDGLQEFTVVVPNQVGAYTVTEDVPTGWRLTQIDCDDADSTSTAVDPGRPRLLRRDDQRLGGRDRHLHVHEHEERAREDHQGRDRRRRDGAVHVHPDRCPAHELDAEPGTGWEQPVRAGRRRVAGLPGCCSERGR